MKMKKKRKPQKLCTVYLCDEEWYPVYIADKSTCGAQKVLVPTRMIKAWKHAELKFKVSQQQMKDACDKENQ